MSRVSVIEITQKTSAQSKKHRSFKCFKTDLEKDYSIYDYKLAMSEILGNRLKEKLGKKYQELEDKDEALTLANKYKRALELGLFDDFEDVINKIYKNRRK